MGQPNRKTADETLEQMLDVTYQALTYVAISPSGRDRF